MDEKYNPMDTVDVMIPGVEPECTKAEKHEWISTQEYEGGLKHNPGVWEDCGINHKESHCINCNMRRDVKYNPKTTHTTAYYTDGVKSYGDQRDGWLEVQGIIQTKNRRR